MAHVDTTANLGPALGLTGDLAVGPTVESADEEATVTPPCPAVAGTSATVYVLIGRCVGILRRKIKKRASGMPKIFLCTCSELQINSENLVL